LFADLYEVLQISPNADAETIHRVYRIQAQRFHPDNKEHGDPEAFRRIYEAYQILGDPKKRAVYDEEYRRAPRRASQELFERTHPTQSVEGEKRKRLEILSILYSKRLAYPGQPSMSLRDLGDVLAIPRDHLEFSLWFLKEGGYLCRTDNAHHTITMKGVELVEANTQPQPQNRLSDGFRVA